MTNQLSLSLDIIANGNERFSGEANRDLGIKRAVEKANREINDWSEIAFKFFCEFAKNSKEPFMTNDVVLASENVIPQPENKKAWGHIAVKAIKNGIVKSIGYSKGKNPKHHCNPRNLYEYIKKEKNG